MAANLIPTILMKINLMRVHFGTRWDKTKSEKN
jgi:hypothetical protein